MIPVNQSKLYAENGIHNGDCFAACLASLLELPLWMVPPFEQMFGRGDWRDRPNLWLSRMFALELVRTEGHDWRALPEFYIANGPGPRGVHHSVIYRRGSRTHDPHWSKDGILAVEWCWHLECELAKDGNSLHPYTSTACQHALHSRCRQSCKFCAARCMCACHVG